MLTENGFPSIEPASLLESSAFTLFRTYARTHVEHLISHGFTCAVKIGTLYVISAFGGSLLSSLSIESKISVGASGALFGLLGAMLSELITNWTIYANKVACLSLTPFSACQTPVASGLTNRFFSVCSTSDSVSHHSHQPGGRNNPPCGQLCPYWGIYVRLSPRVCSSDPSSVWLDQP